MPYRHFTNLLLLLIALITVPVEASQITTSQKPIQKQVVVHWKMQYPETLSRNAINKTGTFIVPVTYTPGCEGRFEFVSVDYKVGALSVSDVQGETWIRVLRNSSVLRIKMRKLFSGPSELPEVNDRSISIYDTDSYSVIFTKNQIDPRAWKKKDFVWTGVIPGLANPEDLISLGIKCHTE